MLKYTTGGPPLPFKCKSTSSVLLFVTTGRGTQSGVKNPIPLVPFITGPEVKKLRAAGRAFCVYTRTVEHDGQARQYLLVCLLR